MNPSNAECIVLRLLRKWLLEGNMLYDPGSKQLEPHKDNNHSALGFEVRNTYFCLGTVSHLGIAPAT